MGSTNNFSVEMFGAPLPEDEELFSADRKK
jgi:hypothetical protein